MKPYVMTLLAGLLVGCLYGVIHVRSPAPPVIALVGLMGILLGEQLTSTIRQAVEHRKVDIARIAADCRGHLLAHLSAVSHPQGDSNQESSK